MADGFQHLIDEHRAVSELLAQYRQDRDDGAARAACTALARHSAVEELVVYPRLRDRVAAGTMLAERAELEHGGIEAEVAHVMASPPTDLSDAMENLTTMVEAHVAFEEQHVFPAMRDTVDAEELARALEDAEQSIRKRAGEPLF